MTLTQTHWDALQAAADRIIPPDGDAGAWQAGVGDYLARQFERGGLQDQVGIYRAGLDALDREALASEQKIFSGLPPGRQDAVLSRVEAARVMVPWPIDPASFFQRLVSHVMEGFYADPGNGGNRDGVAWRMIGFEVRG